MIHFVERIGLIGYGEIRGIRPPPTPAKGPQFGAEIPMNGLSECPSAAFIHKNIQNFCAYSANANVDV